MLFAILCIPILIFGAAEQPVNNVKIPSLQSLCARVLSRYEIDGPEFWKDRAVEDVGAGITVMVEHEVKRIAAEADEHPDDDNGLPWPEGKRLFLLTQRTTICREARLLKQDVRYFAIPLLRCTHVASTDWQKKQKHKVGSVYTFALVEGNFRETIRDCLFDTGLVSEEDVLKWRLLDRAKRKKVKKRFFK